MSSSLPTKFVAENDAGINQVSNFRPDDNKRSVTKEASVPASSLRKHRGTSTTHKRERNIEAMTSTTTTLAWLQKHKEIQQQQQQQQQIEQAKEDVKTVNPQPTAETTPPSSLRPVNNSTIVRRRLLPKDGRIAAAESKRRSLLLYFCFLLFTFLIMVQVVLVERMMENDITIFNGATHNNQHYSIHHVFLRGRQNSPSNTTGTYEGQTNTSEKLELSKHDLTILESSQLLPPISLLQEEEGGASMNIDIQKSLPSVQDIDQLYGSKARIYGLENACPVFRASIQAEERLLAPAGMFNTGTNLIFELLKRNCCIRERQAKYGKDTCGIRFQVPWGKHSPVSFRLHHEAENDHLKHPNALPVVIIKDPYTWMTSMCRHPYSAEWLRDPTHCPNLVDDRAKANTTREDDSMSVTIVYPKEAPIRKAQYKSLVHLWNEYYEQYLRKSHDFPLVAIRFEDLLFHTKDVVTEVCQCAGGSMESTFNYVTESAKEGGVHEGSSGLTTAMILYGNATKRREPYLQRDLLYSKETLSPQLMEIFNYKFLE